MQQLAHHKPGARYLYKYCDVNLNSLNNVFSSRVFFANPYKHFNDPFDCSVLPFYRGTFREAVQYLKTIGTVREDGSPAESEDVDALKAFLAYAHDHPQEPFEMPVTTAGLRKSFRNLTRTGSDVGVLCLSTTNDSVVMFGHYGNKHQGIALEYCIDLLPGEWDGPHPVEYTDRYPPINLVQFDVGHMRKVLTTKSKHWEYEEEYRYFDLVEGTGTRPIGHGALTAVILGCEIALSNEGLASHAARSMGTKLYRASRARDEFKLVLSPVN